MKAQTVKNAVIVPVGAKGGFVVQRPPPGREQQQARSSPATGHSCRGLLDVTDTIAAGVVVPPPDVVRHDGDDPYLVVAADKGTAKFSDIANDLAEEYGFWLGDAFASGGSAGYDHKEMGITARGAWESVRRHFRELGVDADTTDFTAVGIGDMSGDVFGNGMLLSRHLKLVAAFDHRHVFVDPDPDPAASFAERLRLFGLPALVVGRLRPGLLSRGGGVYPRSAKSIELSPRARAGARDRGGDADAERADPRDPEGAGRPALERRHRHLREGDGASATPRSATGPTTPCASTASDLRCPRRGRGRQPRLHAARAGRLRARRRAASPWTRSTTPPASTPPTTR